MLQIRSIVLRGKNVKDATVKFADRANVLAGASDTGKSYLIHCLDYIFGADEMKKRIDEVEPYSQLLVEFENTKSEFLTLVRSLSGGKLSAHNLRLDQIPEAGGEIIAPKRSGKSKAKDVTEVLFRFAGIEEATLRNNDLGDTNRLTIRTILPLFLVNEVSVIDENSPILGKATFDATPRKRAFAYMLSGKDDTGIIASEKKEIASARMNAQLSVISDLLSPIEARLQKRTVDETTESIDKIEETISALSLALSDNSEERAALEEERNEATLAARRADSQIIAIDELLKQYGLLDDRYRTDLERLDFISESAHFFDGLQEVRCPLCEQMMSPYHAHAASEKSENVYAAARSEASKILAHKKDLKEATKTLSELRATHDTERNDAQKKILNADTQIGRFLVPAMQEGGSRLNNLIARRVELEAARSDEIQALDLRSLKERTELTTAAGRTPSKGWEPLPATSLRKFCAEIEAVLKEWKWEGEGRVDFDEIEYDIKIDGQRRQSHGKGVRAVLYSAFVIGLLRYCHANGRPHVGTVVIDSPLTSYKKGKASDGNSAVDAGIEEAFWQSLRNVGSGIQLIIIENKEPPLNVAQDIHYEWFAGNGVQKDQRQGFVPRA